MVWESNESYTQVKKLKEEVEKWPKKKKLCTNFKDPQFEKKRNRLSFTSVTQGT